MLTHTHVTVAHHLLAAGHFSLSHRGIRQAGQSRNCRPRENEHKHEHGTALRHEIDATSPPASGARTPICQYASGMETALKRQAVAQRGKRLEYFTVAWNSLEGLVAVITGALAGSISLVGFGIDSFIEVTSGTVLLWRMAVDADVRRREHSEQLSLRIVGLLFCGRVDGSNDRRFRSFISEQER
jgi:hypothetical protein